MHFKITKSKIILIQIIMAAQQNESGNESDVSKNSDMTTMTQNSCQTSVQSNNIPDKPNLNKKEEVLFNIIYS